MSYQPRQRNQPVSKNADKPSEFLLVLAGGGFHYHAIYFGVTPFEFRHVAGQWQVHVGGNGPCECSQCAAHFESEEQAKNYAAVFNQKMAKGGLPFHWEPIEATPTSYQGRGVFSSGLVQ